jgi:ribosome-associated protein
MADHNEFDHAESGDERPSKSALKRQSTALQKLGESLVALSDKELARIPIADEQLLNVIHEVRRINTRSARRRHLQYLGKLMRAVDPEPLVQALDNLHRERREEAGAFHALEEWRDRLLADGDDAVQALLDQYPQANRQQLRQLIRQHHREIDTGKPPAASRKLFRYLRELAEKS